MAAEEFAEVNVYCRLRPPREDFKRIELKYTEDGHISLTDDKQVGSF